MNRHLRIVIGAVLILLFVGWLIFRSSEPLSSWTASSTLTGWLVYGLAALSFITGVTLIAPQRTAPEHRGSRGKR